MALRPVVRGALATILVGGLSAIMWVIAHHTKAPNPDIEAWPGQVFFGYYFVLIAFALPPLLYPTDDNRPPGPDQRLFLLATSCLSADLILNNISEMTHPLRGVNYGAFLLWDTGTFFIALRAIDLCRPVNAATFKTSLAVCIVPLLKVGREVLRFPYDRHWLGRPAIDFLLGDSTLACWSWVALSVPASALSTAGGIPARQSGLRRVVAFGCAYWTLIALVGVVGLTLYPLDATVKEYWAHLPLDGSLVNIGEGVVAAAMVWGVSCWNWFGVGEAFGLYRGRGR